MSLNVIQSIRQTESIADQVLKDAHEKARQIVTEANHQAVKIKENSLAKAEQDSKIIIAEAEAQTLKEIEKLKRDLADEDNELIFHARKKFDQTVDIIVERIVKIHGNS